MKDEDAAAGSPAGPAKAASLQAGDGSKRGDSSLAPAPVGPVGSPTADARQAEPGPAGEADETSRASGAEKEMPDAESDAHHSLIDDVAALIEDGKTYLEAEVEYQKARGFFVADRARRAAAMAVLALLLAHLALVALVLGLVIALAPLLGAIGATLLVFAFLALVVLLLLKGARRSLREASAAISEQPQRDRTGERTGT